MKKLVRSTAVLLSVLFVLPAWADTPQESNAAANRKASDIDALRRAAAAGDHEANYLLAWAYAKGFGVAADPAKAFFHISRAVASRKPAHLNAAARFALAGFGTKQDLDLARQWADRSARAGDPEGQYLYFVTHVAANSYLADGRPDVGRYFQLARRTVEERRDEILAIQRLSNAAEKGYTPAVQHMFLWLTDRSGRDNRRLALEYFERLSNPPPQLQGLAKALRQLNDMGTTETSPRLFRDVLGQSFPLAVAKLGGLEAITGCEVDKFRVSKANVKLPIADARYLPLGNSSLTNAYLLGGGWEENWTLDFCGKTVDINIRFTADGMGGASFNISL